MILEGDLSVKAAMLGGKRHVETIYIDAKRKDKNAWFVEKKANELGIACERVSREFIESLATGRTHGGMICEAGSRQYDALEDVLRADVPFIALVEGVEDPFNLGYIMRTLYSAGCSGLLLRARSWENAQETILKASAGAAEYITTVLSDDLVRDVKYLKKKGVQVYAAMRRDAITYTEADYTGPVLIMVGGEMRGLSASLLACADQNIYIPYANDFRNALNAAGASAVLGFEVLRQRSIKE